MLSQIKNNQANIIEAKDLSRAFGNNMAVDQVNFSLNRGEICAFLGPNGAGKTTIIKMLTGLLEPSAGQILYEGEKYHPDRRRNWRRFRHLIGWMAFFATDVSAAGCLPAIADTAI